MIRSPVDIKNSNFWERANQQNPTISNQTKRTIIVIGDSKSGKTSFIKLLRGDYDLQAKPTNFIDYFTMKKQGIQIQIYEISSFKYLQSLHFLITPQNSSQLMIVLCLDLTKSQNLVNRINQEIQKIKQQCKEIIDEKNIHEINAYKEQRSKDYHFIEQNEDIEIIDRMPFKFTLVGCMHDLFEKMKAQQKKWVSRCLRYLAHTNESNLIFCSTKNMQTAAQLRSIMIDQIFGLRNKTYSNNKDHNKAIFILTGEDKISEMSLPAFNNSGAFNEIKILQQQLESVFPSMKNIQPPKQEKISLNCLELDPLLKKNRKEIADLLKVRNIKVDNMGLTFQFQTKTGFKNVTNQGISKIQQPKNAFLKHKQTNQQENYMDQGSQDQSQQN